MFSFVFLDIYHLFNILSPIISIEIPNVVPLPLICLYLALDTLLNDPRSYSKKKKKNVKNGIMKF